MTIDQVEKFYEQDEKKYNVSKNKDLLIWLKEMTKKGYHLFIDINDLQELIDNITYWYETKYPEREMNLYKGIRYYDFEDIKSFAKSMNIKQLMFRLPYRQLCLMKCYYRSNKEGVRNVYNDKGELIGYKSVLFISIKKKNIDENSFCEVQDFLLRADCNDGKVDMNYYLKDYVGTDDILLDELLILFKDKVTNDCDFIKLEQCVFDHDCDMELRRRILQLVALKLLYSKNSIPESGYERAKRFIKECNRNLNLNLTTDEIDAAIKRDYTNEEKGKKFKKNIPILIVKKR